MHEYCYLKYVGEEPDEVYPDPDDYLAESDFDEDGNICPTYEYGFFVRTETVLDHIRSNPDSWPDSLHQLKSGRIDLPERYKSAAERIEGPLHESHGNSLKTSFSPEHPQAGKNTKSFQGPEILRTPLRRRP